MSGFTGDILGVEETANFLEVQKSTVYSYIHKNLIPYYKPKYRKVYFKKSDLVAFILNEDKRVKSNSELKEEVW